MIKKLLVAILVALPFTSMAQKFGVVDLESIFTAMPETAAMQTQLQETTSRYEEEFSKLQEEVNKLYAEYQAIANDANTPESIKERRVQEIQERAGKVDQFRNTASQDIARLQEQLMAPISQRLNEAVKAVGQEGGFTFVFPNEPQLLLYVGSDVTDLTGAVRTKLGLPAAAAAPAAN
ncbi:MAG: OmpH family outer membrane protein [Muribaculaceae bacterium]|nr:OmpH family outer membrane protein [Muribaculaceae bacterium]